MHAIRIPEGLYTEVAKAAAARHLSIEDFVLEAVQLHIRDVVDNAPPLRLSEEQLAAVREGQAQVEAGMVLTMDQVRENLAKLKADYLRDNPQ
ncbi:MAG TPA: DUF1778 domain-containing protein [Fimbriimonadaceae bacterium]|jgi:predicted transcriptional regulator